MTEKDYTTKINERLRLAFGEVMVKAASLIDEALNDHHKDLQAIFLRDRTLSVSLGLGVELTEGGLVEVALTTGYVKEKVKDKTTARVTPGQMEVPPEAYRTVSSNPAKAPHPSSGGGEVRRLGPAPKLIGGGEPFAMPASGEEWVPFAGAAGPVTDEKARLARVKKMSAGQLRVVLAMPADKLQRSVWKAAERRLSRLSRGQTCKNCAHGSVPGGCDVDADRCKGPGCAVSSWKAKAS